MDNKQPKLESKFDPIWQADFKDLQALSKTAFILRQIYRLYRNSQTNQCNLSDYKIREITSWSRNTIQKAKYELIKKNHIIPNGFHLFTIPLFHKLTNSSETELSQQLRNRAINSSETELSTAQKLSHNSSKTELSLYTDTDITEVAEQKNTHLSPALKQTLQALLESQGHNKNNGLMSFYSKVTLERLGSGWHEGIIKIALKRGFNSQLKIHEILANSNLEAIKTKQAQDFKDNEFKVSQLKAKEKIIKEGVFEGSKKND